MDHWRSFELLFEVEIHPLPRKNGLLGNFPQLICGITVVFVSPKSVVCQVTLCHTSQNQSFWDAMLERVKQVIQRVGIVLRAAMNGPMVPIDVDLGGRKAAPELLHLDVAICIFADFYWSAMLCV